MKRLHTCSAALFLFGGFTGCASNWIGSSAASPAAYDWRLGAAQSVEVVPGGKQLHAEIRNLNRLCYQFSRSDKDVVAIMPTSDILKYLGADATSLSKLTTEGLSAGTKPEAAAAKADPSTKGRGGASAPLVKQPSVPALDFTRPQADLVAAVDLLTKAKESFNKAVDGLNEQMTALKSIDTSLHVFYANACPGGGVRGPADPDVRWSPVNQAINAFTAGIPGALKDYRDRAETAKKQLEDSKNRLADIRTRATKQPEYKAFIALPEKAADIAILEHFQTAIGEYLSKDPDALKTLPAQTATLVVRQARITAQIADHTMTISRPVGMNIDTVIIKTVATGWDDIESVKGVTFEDVFTIPVHRQHRMFTTAGAMFSSLEEHAYDRASLPKTDTTTYSTFIDRKPNSKMAFSPTIMQSMTIGTAGGFDFAGTLGVGVRSVNDKLSPDLLFGPSISLGDQVVLTAAWHRGRVETLLLGSADSIRKTPVATSITRQTAVGEKWRDAWAIIVSFKLP